MSPGFRGLVLLATLAGIAVIPWRLAHQGISPGYLARNGAALLLSVLPLVALATAVGAALIALLRRR